MKNTGRGERTALGKMLTAMKRIIQGEIGRKPFDSIQTQE